jgi:hypothetical protein
VLEAGTSATWTTSWQHVREHFAFRVAVAPDYSTALATEDANRATVQGNKLVEVTDQTATPPGSFVR